MGSAGSLCRGRQQLLSACHFSAKSDVWKEVERQQRSLAVASETAAMSDTFQSYQDRIREFRDKLSYVDGASGIVVAVGRGGGSMEKDCWLRKASVDFSMASSYSRCSRW